MTTPRRALLAHIEFLHESGNLYVEGLGEPELEAIATSGASNRISSRPDRRATPKTKTPRTATTKAETPEPAAPISKAPMPAVNLTFDERAERLAKAARAVDECTKCELCKTRNKTVFGDGGAGARLCFVGEAPGAEEDRTGVPFVGRGGQLLTKMIEAIGFERAEVYICNTIKCRPPQNRDPTPSEKEACRPYLEEQLRTLGAQIIVAVGAHAAGYLTGVQSSLGAMRGKWHEFEGIPVMVTYHPAFLLRSPGFKGKAWEDMQMLAARYNELNPTDRREIWHKASK